MFSTSSHTTTRNIVALGKHVRTKGLTPSKLGTNSVLRRERSLEPSRTRCKHGLREEPSKPVGKDPLIRAMALEDWEDANGDVTCALGNNLARWGLLNRWNNGGLVQDCGHGGGLLMAHLVQAGVENGCQLQMLN